MKQKTILYKTALNNRNASYLWNTGGEILLRHHKVTLKTEEHRFTCSAGALKTNTVVVLF